jgi:prepilin-type N-terminal cleavage/methylation domain-containing protein/prepilin-type processing-associated H-X9-DG protein
MKRSLLLPSRPGFTLVELLVVIGIIALLLAIALPALSLVRQQARAANCLSHLREIGRLSTLRASELDGFVQIAGTIRLHDAFDRNWDLAGSLGDSARSRYTYRPWGTVLTADPFRETVLTYRRDLEQFLSPEEPGSLSQIFLCPSETSEAFVQTVEFRIGTTVHFLADPEPTHYAVNEVVVGVGLAPESTHRLRGNLTRVRNPSRTVFFGDARLEDDVVGPFVWSVAEEAPSVSLADVLEQPMDPSKLGPSPRPGDRHRGQGNYLFVDGHATSVITETQSLRNWMLLAE